MPDLTVLIIEDDEIAAEILQKFIQHRRPKTQVDWCWDGYEALIMVQEQKPDIIFLDYMMPKIDGIEFLNSLKQLESFKDYFLAVISAYVDKEKEQEFYNLGADFVLPKPIKIEQIEELMDKFEEMWEQKKKSE